MFDILVLSPGKIPTNDYYVTSRLHDLTNGRLRWIDASHPPQTDWFSFDLFVVIVRHAHPAWLRALAKKRDRLRKIVYLMDDDIPAAWRCRDVPVDYGLWSSWRYWRIRSLLRRLCDEWWVSTPELARRYPGSKVLPPVPYAVDGRPAPAGCRRWGYHGTRVHARELRWIVPIVAAVQRSVPEAEFEVFGGAVAKRLFAHVPRVKVRTPLPWPEYVDFCHANPLAVGLAPLLPGYFNEARSHTKAFDIVRAGAVGIFSDRGPYKSVFKGGDVILLSDDQSRWVNCVVQLLRDDGLRIDKFKALLTAFGMKGLTAPPRG